MKVVGHGYQIASRGGKKVFVPRFFIFSSVFRIPVVAASGEVELAYNNVDHEAIVITAYEPDHETWSGDFTRRRS